MSEHQLPAETQNIEVLIPVENRDAHPDMFKTLDLLAIRRADGPIYFVIEGCTTFGPLSEVRRYQRYFYEEHTCPTNFIQIPAIFHDGDDDPHGLFEYIDTAWMTTDYIAAKEKHGEEDYLRTVFPQLNPQPS